MHCTSLVAYVHNTVMPDILYKWCSYVYSYYFIANSTIYLTAADFLDS